MYTFWTPKGFAAVAALAALTAPTGAWAQTVNPYFQIRPGLTIAQAAYNTALMGRAASFVPPYALGYNPYVFGGAGFPAAVAPPLALPYAAPTINPYLASAPLAANPYAATITSTPYLPGNMGYDPGAYNNLYNNSYGNNPYGYGYGESPIGGYMRGYADVISSVTRGMINEQQASLLRQQVQREKMENQRRAFDNWLYFREKTPTAEDDRQRFLQMQVRRALNDPPVGEVYSGRAMNTILDDLGKKIGKDANAQGPPIPLDDDVVRHLNFTGQENKGNPGLLKNEGKLSWPLVLRGTPYKAERELLNDLTPTVYDQAVSGRVDPGSLESMGAALKRLQQQLNDSIRDLTPNQYGEARRFLSDFEDALALLRQPNASDFFGQKAPKGKTVADLVQQLLGKGVRFAPATAGDESAYIAIHRALAVYASNATAQVATEKPEK